MFDLEFDESTRARLRRIDALVARYEALPYPPTERLRRLLQDARMQMGASVLEYLIAADKMLGRPTRTRRSKGAA